jgi:hypothetical protein
MAKQLKPEAAPICRVCHEKFPNAEDKAQALIQLDIHMKTKHPKPVQIALDRRG